MYSRLIQIFNSSDNKFNASSNSEESQKYLQALILIKVSYFYLYYYIFYFFYRNKIYKKQKLLKKIAMLQMNEKTSYKIMKKYVNLIKRAFETHFNDIIAFVIFSFFSAVLYDYSISEERCKIHK